MLDLCELQKGMPAITPSFGTCLAEAGGYCFEEQGHSKGSQITIRGCVSGVYKLNWPPITTQIKRCYNDQELATEFGAYGVAFLIIKEKKQYTVIERSRKGPGFDYWIGKEESDEIFQDKKRLEVSGIRSGNESQIKTRVKQKKDQTKPSDGTFPAFIVVVEFSNPVAEVQEK
jgi:hypothetical protein